MFCFGGKLQLRWEYHSGGWDDNHLHHFVCDKHLHHFVYDKHLHHFDILICYEQQKKENSDDFFEALIDLCLKYISLSNYVCVDLCRHYKYRHTRIYICEYIYMYICVYIYKYIRICIHIYVHIYVNAYVYNKCICLYMYIHMSYIHICWRFFRIASSHLLASHFLDTIIIEPHHNYE